MVFIRGVQVIWVRGWARARSAHDFDVSAPPRSSRGGAKIPQSRALRARAPLTQITCTPLVEILVLKWFYCVSV